jgi:hypothetical protein
MGNIMGGGEEGVNGGAAVVEGAPAKRSVDMGVRLSVK